ncbi:MAG: F0F1 ATP synthase subunit A [Roseiflexaceae bacterium]
MSRADLHISAAAEPLVCIGGALQGAVCSPGTVVPITNGLVMTVLIDLLLVLTIIFGVRNLQLVPRGLQNTIEAVVEGVYNFALSVDRKNVAKFFPVPATIFLFFLYANMFALVPGVGSIGMCTPKHSPEAVASIPYSADASVASSAAKAEGEEGASKGVLSTLPGACDGVVIPYLRAPAADLNVTIAFALVAWIMIQFFGFQALGVGYLGKFFNFREGALGVFVGLIELISEFSRIISFAFRIYGNIFGGEVILAVMSFLFAYLLPLPFYGFEVFVALMQALIFAILTLIFMQMAVQAHGGHDDHGHHDDKPVEAADLPEFAGGSSKH